MPPSNDIREFKDILKTAKHIIAVAGAGLSAASGIPTFRGTGGLWRRYDAMSLATPKAFKKQPSLVWQFYHYRRERYVSSLPKNSNSQP
jgi:NAD+-dependent protein deacetylase sirtuin 5